MLIEEKNLEESFYKNLLYLSLRIKLIRRADRSFFHTVIEHCRRLRERAITENSSSVFSSLFQIYS